MKTDPFGVFEINYRRNFLFAELIAAFCQKTAIVVQFLPL